MPLPLAKASCFAFPPPPQLGYSLVDRVKYGFLQSRSYVTAVDVSADDDDDIPMPATAGQPVRCAAAAAAAAAEVVTAFAQCHCR